MKIVRILYSVFCFMSVISGSAQTPTMTADQGTPVYVFPKIGTVYNLNTGTSSTVLVKWKVTGGSFEANALKTELSNYFTNATVYWDNVAYTSGKEPQGTITADVQYTNPKSISYKQKINSINGYALPTLQSSQNTKLNFGSQTINLSLSNNFLFPDKKTLVNTFEWTIPSGWKTDEGKTGTFTVKTSKISVITDGVSEGDIKVRGVNNMYDTDKSNYSTLTFTRNLSFQSYPSTYDIKYGITQSFTYTVSQAPGCSYEWSYPEGWDLISGINTNSVILSKSPCANKADVKVRVKTNSGETSQWYKSPNTTVIYPNINTSANIMQHTEVNLTLDLPNDNIQTFTLTGDGLTVKQQISKNTLKCLFEKNGNIVVTASITLNGCNTNSLYFTKSITVEELKNVTMSGPSILCSTGIYSLDTNIPGTTWYVSDKLKILSGQGTSSISVQSIGIGDAQIRYKIPNASSANGFKNVYSGKPLVASFYGATEIPAGVFTCYEALPDYNRLYNTKEVSYIWSIDQPGVSLSIEGNKCCITFPTSGWGYRLTCQAVTSCGMGMPMKIDIRVGSRYYISKTSGIIYIQEIDITEANAYIEKNTKQTTDYELYNSSTGSLVKKGLVNKKNGSINCESLSNGIYILKLKITGTKFESYKINF